ncbi:MAG: polyketide synthase dehydratase domain-containing protein, partial [Pirellulales bacterium]|nr:polyketide synthase dehydratase domain-containing protein [Pirellulales bacterium]
ELPDHPTVEHRQAMIESIEGWISHWLVVRAGVDPEDIDLEKPFADYGLDSMTAVELSGEIEDWSGVELTPVVAWNHPTVARMSRFITSQLITEIEPDPSSNQVSDAELEDCLTRSSNFPRTRSTMPSPTNDAPEPAGGDRLADRLANLSPAQRDLLNQRLAARNKTVQQQSSAAHDNGARPAPDGDVIAIVGMGCRFPGAESTDEFWELIDQGREVVGPIPAERWERERFYDPTGRSPGKMSVDVIGSIDQVDRFDPAFFGIAPREASRMDPQQRLLLEVVWETFENAGIRIDSMAGSNTGVFIGIGGTDYSKVPARYPNYFEHVDAHIGTGNALSIAAGRISYLFDFRGPSFIVDTACSSALVAIHSAATALLRGECDTAVAGGVNLILSPETTIAFSKARMLSPHGRCRPFDDSADGYVRGEGCGIVLLKRLPAARQAGDRILGILRGSAVNQDGRTSGITAPNSEAQHRVIDAAMKAAGVSPNDISYIEAHGTGTPLGDPIELLALGEAFGHRQPDLPPIRVGSVKANIGHTETASGVAGLLKVLQMFAHGKIPAQANFEKLNANVRLPERCLKIACEQEDWQPAAAGRFIAGVSSFGFGGTNAHLIVERPPETKLPAQSPPRVPPPSFCLPISARDETALQDLAALHCQASGHLDANQTHDACVSAALHRAELPIRAVAVADSPSALRASLEAYAQAGQHPNVIVGRRPAGRRSRIAMMFTGQGSQYLGMAKRLQQTLPTFAQSVDRCAEILADVMEVPLSDILSGRSELSIDHTSLAQPAICAVQCALVDALAQVGIRPDVVAGHSIGEIAALYAAGAFELQQALLVAAHRGRVMGALPPGGTMSALLTDAETVTRWIEQSDSTAVIATMNGSGNTVIAGPDQAVQQLMRIADEHDVASRPLPVSHAFHSPLMSDAIEPLRQKLQSVFTSVDVANAVTFVSSLTGRPYESPIDVDYWIKHLVQPVRFTEVIRQLEELKLDLAIEVGPSPQLTGMVRRSKAADGKPLSLPTVPILDKKQDDHVGWNRTLASAWCVGAKVDWKAAHQHHPWQRRPLPTYPFQRQRFWYDPPRIGNHGTGGPLVHPLLGSRQSLATGGTIYEAAVRDDDPGYLQDHVVGGAVTMPAAAWIEALRAAAAETFTESEFELRDLEVHRALFLNPGDPVRVQTSVQPVRGGRCRIQIDTCPDTQDAQWQTCASVMACGVQASVLKSDLPDRSAQAASIDRDQLYESMAASELQYGEFFQVLESITSDGRIAVGEFSPAKSLAFEIEDQPLHPTLIDGALQLIATVVPPDCRGEGATYLPVGVDRICLGKTAAPTAARVRRSSPQTSKGEIRADVELFHEGDLVARLEGVRLKRLSRESSSIDQDPANWIHTLEWTPSSALTPDKESELSTSARPRQYRHFGGDTLKQLLPVTPVTEKSPPHWVWTLPPSSGADNTSETLADLLDTIQQAIRHDPSPLLSVITQQAFAATEADESVDPTASAAIGMARVAANEHPQLQLRILDVDQLSKRSVGRVQAWLDRVDNETELVLRGQHFYQVRLQTSPRLFWGKDQDTEVGLPDRGSYRMRLDGTNRTEGLWVERIAVPQPQPGEVAVKVDAVGLNFSDVLKSMGLYPGIRDAVVPMGIEVCGRVTAVGRGVDSHQVGARVMGVVPFGFSSDVVTK